jgi:hypothetical protein
MGRYAKLPEKITLSGWLVDKFMEIYGIITIFGQFGYKKRSLSGLNSGNEVPKNIS